MPAKGSSFIDPWASFFEEDTATMKKNISSFGEWVRSFWPSLAKLIEGDVSKSARLLATSGEQIAAEVNAGESVKRRAVHFSASIPEDRVRSMLADMQDTLTNAPPLRVNAIFVNNSSGQQTDGRLPD
jgi:hypothetical protein